MAITNIPQEVDLLRKAVDIQNRIDGLSQERALFALKALLLANHVDRYVMEKTIELAETVRTS